MSPSLGFGDLHLQGWEIPFLVGRIPNFGVRQIFSLCFVELHP